MEDERKKDGPSDFNKDEERTPIIVPTGVQDLLKRIANVRLRIRDSRGAHERTERLLDDLERLVQRGGSDAEVRALYVKLAGHFESLSDHMRDEMSVILGNLGRAFTRMSQD